LIVNDASDAESTHRFSYNESIGDFIQGNQLMVRFELNFTQSGADDDILLIDYMALRILYQSRLNRPCSNFTTKFIDIKNKDAADTLIASTRSIIYNTTVKIDNGTGYYQRYLPFTRLNVLVSTPFSSDNLTYKIFGLNYTSSINISSQINENYSYALPSLVTNVTPFVAVNDTRFNYTKTQLRIPKRGLDINIILHCISYNYSNGQCLSFEFNETDDFEYNETADYIIFNVTSFDSFGGGSASTLPNITLIRIWNVTSVADRHRDGTLIYSGLETVFHLYKDDVYRVQFIVENSGRRWSLLSEDVAYHSGLNRTWRINATRDIWYVDSVGTSNRTGGIFANGKVSWNLGLGGRIDIGKNGSFMYVVNITTDKDELYPVYFLVNDTSRKSGSYDNSFYNISDMVGPLLDLLYPVDMDNNTVGMIRFNFTASDNSGRNISCDFMIGSQVNQSFNYLGGTKNISIDFAAGGIYNWTVNCTDESLNMVNKTRMFYVVSRPYVSINISEDNRSMKLNWTSVPLADSYYIYISNDSTLFNDMNGTSTQLNFTDRNASRDNRRYYKIAAVKGSAVALSNITVGKHTTHMVSNWSLISVPFNQSDWVLYNGTVGRDIALTPGDCIRSIWQYNNEGKFYESNDYLDTHWQPSLGSEDFKSLNYGSGYWAEVNKTCNMTFYGIVPSYNKTYQLYPEWNIMSHHSALDQPLYDESVRKIIDVNPEETTSVILRYNNEASEYEVTVFYPGWGWWPSFNNQDFLELESMRGYYMDQLDYANWTHDPRK
jgi:hypothetical protein